ncbi:putative peptidoglycan lipid II flippase [Desulfuromusa kysingii]|uniref:Probable lipid II flippase MurJ n=1 Tax=Desulfuromusa kysingii TaxID=37625 RepID=A0A1H4BIA0_9BACT|nr:murein biosynthesis integral membrane protein MurJ [Desulfuromusa kysingii]SEA47748.1 putative peptidoglycan lipid II flippase [Desulfuromusa kysingii]
MTNKKKMTAATIIMASATSMSRVAGLVRDIVVARLFGAGMMTDAFFMAFTIPNLLRRFFGEGSLTAAFVPIFSETFHRRGEKDAQQLANRCVSLLMIVMLVVVSLGVLFSPWIVQGVGYGFGQVEGKLQLTNQLNRIMFPYIGFVSVLALLTGILNVRGHFFVPAVSPLFLNLSMIISALTLGHLFAQPIFALAIGVLLGGIVQLLLQVPVLCRYKIRLRFDFNFRHDPSLRKIRNLMLPGIAGVAIYQINIIVTRLLASFLPEGSVSYLYYGQRLFEFPQGIFIVSLAQAALPMMSRQVAEDDKDGLQQSLNFALTLITIFTLPAIVGLILCAKPIYSLFFFGGEFNMSALENTSLALICYAPGLIFVGYSRIAAQTFYALKDTRTPVIISFWTLLVNLFAGLLLMQYWGFLGLAISLTLASLFNAFMLLLLLQRKVGSFLQTSLYKPVIKVIPACVLMAMVVTMLLGFADWMQVGAVVNKSIVLFGAIAVGLLIFFGSCYLLRVEEIRQGWQLLRGRNQR